MPAPKTLGGAGALAEPLVERLRRWLPARPPLARPVALAGIPVERELTDAEDLALAQRLVHLALGVGEDPQRPHLLGEPVRLLGLSLTRRERRHLRGRGRSDARDALAIARAALAEPKLPELAPHDATRDLKLAYDYRLQLSRERTRTANRLHVDLLVLEPGYERRIPHLASKPMLDRAARLLRDRPEVRASLARRRLARLRRLDREIADLGLELRGMVELTETGLVEHCGISFLNAARILGEVGDIRRFPSKDAFAAGNGTAPVPASSGMTQRMRLNRGGNRRLNYAIHIMALTQSRCDERARAYLARRRSEGKTSREAMRALKRRLSDVVYQQLREDQARRLEVSGVGAQRRHDT